MEQAARHTAHAIVEVDLAMDALRAVNEGRWHDQLERLEAIRKELVNVQSDIEAVL